MLVQMATQSDVRRIALSLPETREQEGRFAFEVLNGAKYKGFAWVWMERVHPRKPRVPCPGVLAVRVANLDAKEILLMADQRKFFTEPHYDGFPAVLVRLEEIGRAELGELLKQAWAAQAPKTRLANSGARGASARKSSREPGASPRTAPAAKPARRSAAAGAKDVRAKRARGS